MILREALLNGGYVKIAKDEELFTLSNGKKSNYFVDIKEACLNPEILNEIVNNIRGLYWKLQDDWILDADLDYEFDKVASVAVGGIPIGTAVSLEYNISQIIVRSEKHSTGTKSRVIGNCKGNKILLFEDVATTGSSIVSAVNAIREVGGICGHCIVIVDRQEGAEKNCRKNHIELYSVLKKSDFSITE